jgi:hypothetical protein
MSQDLEHFVFDLLPLLPTLHQLDSNFAPYYVVTAVRKFFFFLDPGRKGNPLASALSDLWLFFVVWVGC